MNLKVFVAELVGTFALVFIGAGAGALGAGLVGVALAHGLTLAVFAYIFGYISGTHVNPAVTFGLALNGTVKWMDAVVNYWLAQFIGGIAAAGVLVFVVGADTLSGGATIGTVTGQPVQAVIVEAVLTFFLVNSVLHGAVAGKAREFAGFVIGMTLAFCILMGGSLTGASLNPARTFGPALFTGTLDSFWIYLVGPFLGAAAAAGLFKFLKD
jgi:aquaporin Z